MSRCGTCEYPGGICSAGCPNYEPPILGTCACCGADLTVGDRVFDLPNGDMICWTCLEDDSRYLEAPDTDDYDFNPWEDY